MAIAAAAQVGFRRQQGAQFLFYLPGHGGSIPAGAGIAQKKSAAGAALLVFHKQITDLPSQALFGHRAGIGGFDHAT